MCNRWMIEAEYTSQIQFNKQQYMGIMLVNAEGCGFTFKGFATCLRKVKFQSGCNSSILDSFYQYILNVGTIQNTCSF